MTDLKQAAQQALEAWEHINKYGFVLADYEGPMEQAITALKAALAEQEPVAWACFKNGELQTELVGTEADVDFWCASDEPEMQGMVKGALYTHPPRREWQFLSAEERYRIADESASTIVAVLATEAKLKEKNHDRTTRSPVPV